jgi:hypothetical protein
MRKRLNQKSNTAPQWLQLAKEEKLLFCGTSPARLKNPVAGNARHPECVVLTNKRLVALCPLGVRTLAPAVTTMPLSRIEAIQTTALSWNAMAILGIIIGFLFYIIPGIIGLIYMLMNTGPRVNVIAGNLRMEIKFSPFSPELLREFITLLDLYTAFK